MISCNLCQEEFDENDPLINERKIRHERFHLHCKKEKRNTTEGVVKWIGAVKNTVTGDITYG